MPPIVIAAGITAAASGAASVYGANKSSSAANTAARYQADSANRAAEIEAQATRDALAFQREQEAIRRAEWEKTQAQNYGIWQSDYDYRKSQDALANALREKEYGLSETLGLGNLALGREQEANRMKQWQTRLTNLAPYRAVGSGSIAQLMRPIAYRGNPKGSVAELMGA